MKKWQEQGDKGLEGERHTPCPSSILKVGYVGTVTD